MLQPLKMTESGVALKEDVVHYFVNVVALRDKLAIGTV